MTDRHLSILLLHGWAIAFTLILQSTLVAAAGTALCSVVVVADLVANRNKP